jgi:hypothetical protein
LLPALPVQGQWLLIALSAVGFDLGLQSSLVAHQNLVYSLEPQARGRLNALLFTMVFIGMALGSVLGSQVYALANWEGVVTLATFSSAIALVIRLTGNPSLSKRRLPKKCPLRGVKERADKHTQFQDMFKKDRYRLSWNSDIPCISVNAL